MGYLNPNLSAIIQKHISPIKQPIKIINNESDVMRIVRETGMLNIDGCEVNYKLNVNSILQQAHNEGIVFNNIRIVNSRLYKGATFYDVTINGNLYFWENNCNNCDFSNIKVEGCSYFSNTIFNSSAIFDHAQFHKDVFFWGVEFLGESHFRNCSFAGRLDFWCASFQRKADFSHSVFNKDVDFSNTSFEQDVLFKDTSFGNIGYSSIAIFDNVTSNGCICFTDSSIRSEMSMCKSQFAGFIDFSRCSMYHTLTSSLTSYNQITFNYSHIYSPLYLLDCSDDIDCINFEHVWVDSIVNIRHNTKYQVNKMSFNKSIFSNNSIITVEGVNIRDSKFELNFCNILGVVSIYSSIINLLELKCSSVIGSLIIKDTNINLIDLTNSTSTGRIITDSNYCFHPINRETANILRHQKENEGDIIMSLKYKEIEMRRYKEDFDRLSLLGKLKNIDEIIIVKLNFWSNDYGQSWTRGVIFTLAISFIFTLTLSFINNEIILKDIMWHLTHQDFWREVINFLWFPSSEFKSDELIYIIIALLGKLLVAYGMFQTAMSFRKYSKS